MNCYQCSCGEIGHHETLRKFNFQFESEHEYQILMDTIYTVTSIYSTGGRTERTRCVGWYSKLEKAINAVKNDVGSLCEAGYYNYVVIEESPEGIYGISETDKQWWFFRDYGENQWVECDKPSEYKNVVGFGIG